MSARTGLSPMPDEALRNLGRNLYQVYLRLHVHHGPNVPTLGQFVMAFSLYIRSEDEKRRRRHENNQSSAPSQDEHETLPSSEVRPSGFARRHHLPGSSGISHEQDSGEHESPTVLLGDVEHQQNYESTDVNPEIRHSLLSQTVTHQVQDAHELLHFLRLAGSAYAKRRSEHDEHLRFMQDDFDLLEARWLASTFHPAYNILIDYQNSVLVVAIRGSKQPADFLTNMSCHVAPFLSGYGHDGVIQSARNIALTIRSHIFDYLAFFRPESGVVFVGHSLGGAIAAMLTLMWQTETFDQNADLGEQPHDSPTVRYRYTRDKAAQILQSDDHHINRGSRAPDSLCVRERNTSVQARGFAFSTPPCLSPDLAEQAKEWGVLTLVFGLDIVPRLSVRSIDNLLQKLSRFDWQADASRRVENRLTSYGSPLLGTEGASRAASVVTGFAPVALPLAIESLGTRARQASNSLRTRRNMPGNEHELSRRPWDMSLACEAFLTAAAGSATIFTRQFCRDDSHRPSTFQALQRQIVAMSVVNHTQATTNNAIVGHRTVSAEYDILHLPGRILHLERHEIYSGRNAMASPTTLLEKHATDFLEIEASEWMVHDHRRGNIIEAIENLRI